MENDEVPQDFSPCLMAWLQRGASGTVGQERKV
jgi:hypothetical protein